MICQVNKSKGDINETTSEPKLDVIYPKPRKRGIFRKSTKLEVTEDDETKNWDYKKMPINMSFINVNNCQITEQRKSLLINIFNFSC